MSEVARAALLLAVIIVTVLVLDITTGTVTTTAQWTNGFIIWGVLSILGAIDRMRNR